jgi:hypothetical protein
MVVATAAIVPRIIASQLSNASEDGAGGNGVAAQILTALITANPRPGSAITAWRRNGEGCSRSSSGSDRLSVMRRERHQAEGRRPPRQGGQGRGKADKPGQGGHWQVESPMQGGQADKAGQGGPSR